MHTHIYIYIYIKHIIWKKNSLKDREKKSNEREREGRGERETELVDGWKRKILCQDTNKESLGWKKEIRSPLLWLKTNRGKRKKSQKRRKDKKKKKKNIISSQKYFDDKRQSWWRIKLQPMYWEDNSMSWQSFWS